MTHDYADRDAVRTEEADLPWGASIDPNRGIGIRLSWYRGEHLFKNGITWVRVIVSWRRREHDIGGLWWDQRRKRVRILRPNGKAVTA